MFLQIECQPTSPVCCLLVRTPKDIPIGCDMVDRLRLNHTSELPDLIGVRRTLGSMAAALGRKRVGESE